MKPQSKHLSDVGVTTYWKAQGGFLRMEICIYLGWISLCENIATDEKKSSTLLTIFQVYFPKTERVDKSVFNKTSLDYQTSDI